MSWKADDQTGAGGEDESENMESFRQPIPSLQSG